MDFLNQLVSDVNGVLWGVFFLIPLLCGTGIFYTIKLRFVQVRKFGLAARFLLGGASLFGKRADKSGMSSFQALATAVAAQVGTGNVAGTATALVAGGPGSLFWLWVAAFFGMATIFAEAVLAQTYRTKDEQGRVLGGPAYYITLGMGEKWRPLAVFFSIAIIIALGCIGNMVQSNSIAHAMQTAFNVPAAVSGVVCAVLAGLVFFGGVGRLASVTEKIVPFMAAIYLIGGLWVIGAHITEVIPAFRLIFVAAFDPEAVMGGALGLTVAKAMQFGVARGLFSNEAGMGSTPHAHARRPRRASRRTGPRRDVRRLYDGRDRDLHGHRHPCDGRARLQDDGYRAHAARLHGGPGLLRHGLRRRLPASSSPSPPSWAGTSSANRMCASSSGPAACWPIA